MISGFSDEEILHEALVAPRGALVPLADTKIIERHGWWQIVTSSLTRGGMNEIVCTELSAASADAIIDETIASYRKLGLRFRWSVGAGTKPEDLAHRLARRGLQQSEALVMARATSNTIQEDTSAITINEVSLANVDEFTRVMAEGWHMDAAPLDVLHRRMLADPAQRHRVFVARYEGVVAAAAGYVALERSAYLIGAVTLGTSLARAQTSALILARLGFPRGLFDRRLHGRLITQERGVRAHVRSDLLDAAHRALLLSSYSMASRLEPYALRRRGGDDAVPDPLLDRHRALREPARNDGPLVAQRFRLVTRPAPVDLDKPVLERGADQRAESCP